MASSRRERHYEREEAYQMSQQDKYEGKCGWEFYDRKRYEDMDAGLIDGDYPSDFIFPQEFPKRLVDVFSDGDRLPEDRTAEEIKIYDLDDSIVYTPICDNGLYVLYKKHSDFLNVYYVRILEIYENRYCDGCGSSRCRSRYCRGGYTHEYEERAYYINLSVRDNIAEAKCMHIFVKNAYNNLKENETGIYQIAREIEDNKQVIKNTGKKFYNKFSNTFSDDIISHIVDFV